jgi:hypothetical protein
MERLGRYPLSVILSFSSETDGTSFLLTKKQYTRTILPLFQVDPNNNDSTLLLRVLAVPSSSKKRRHKFVVSPVQDATVLLARLNTRQLGRRKRLPLHDAATILGLSTVGIANQEWQQQTLHFQYPPELELLRFLSSPHDNKNEFSSTLGTTFLASYPRSGNSLARTLLERTTGIVTGSDTRPDRTLSRELAETYNLVGEGVVRSVAFVKTHWPERVGNARVAGQRVILLVRNPYDAVDSYWNMNATKSHTRTVTDAVYAQYRDKFECLARNEIQIWLSFHQYWLSNATIPVLVVRFEDLIQDPAGELRRILAFSLQTPSLSEYWEARIRHVTGAPIDTCGSYPPRAASGTASLGKSLRLGRYSDELLAYFHETSRNFAGGDLLQLFGYELSNGDCLQNKSMNDDLLLRAFGTQSSSGSTLTLNEGLLVRSPNCPFGRDMMLWRHSVTNNDQNPLPTVIS